MFAATFAVLPVLLLGGVASQGIAIYLCAVTLPIASGGLTHWRKLDSRALVQAGKAALVLFFLFPLGQLLVHGFAALPDGSSPSLSQWLFQSRLSSAVGVTGLLFIGLSKAAQSSTIGARTTLFRDPLHGQTGPLMAFAKGLAAASLILCAYVTWQHFSGFEYRSADMSLGTAKEFTPGRFRAPGFFGHPLSLAACALALATFAGAMALLAPHTTLKRLFAATAGLQTTIVLLSGGRSAMLIALALAVAALARLAIKTAPRRRLTFGAILAGLMGFFVWAAQERFADLIARAQHGGIFRLTFWQVHWDLFLERPWFGQGQLWLSGGGREARYDLLGFADFPYKYNAHNIYVELLATVGVIGALCFFVALGGLARQVRKAVARAPSARLTLKATGIALAANLLHGLTQNTLFDAHVSYAYLALLWLSIWQGIWEITRNANAGAVHESPVPH